MSMRQLAILSIVLSAGLSLPAHGQFAERFASYGAVDSSDERLIEELEIQIRKFFNPSFRWGEDELARVADEISSYALRAKSEFGVVQKWAFELVEEIRVSLSAERQVDFFEGRYRFLYRGFKDKVDQENRRAARRDSQMRVGIWLGLPALGAGAGLAYLFTRDRKNGSPVTTRRAFMHGAAGAACGLLLAGVGNSALKAPREISFDWRVPVPVATSNLNSN